MSVDEPSVLARVTGEFHKRFGGEPEAVARAPGRVNLIGEHTDYNDGFVLPMAIDREVCIAFRKRDDRRVSAFSLDFEEAGTIEFENLRTSESAGLEGWINYVAGVAWGLQQLGVSLTGWEGVIGGDVPVGAGLSSSAALELATARAFAHASDLEWNPLEMGRICQRAENEWVGVRCGIMDQLIAAVGIEGHAVLIDCRSLAFRPAPLPAGSTVVVLDNGTRRGLVDSAYNERRLQCESVARHFGVAALRDLEIDLLNQRAAELDRVEFQRARHVVTENDRTVRAAHAMQQGDANEVGSLMDQSHASLRDDFEVSSPALDAMVETARRHPSCLGSRLTGAGFGGCAIALVDSARVDDFATAVCDEYQSRTGTMAKAYPCAASQGASVRDWLANSDR